MLKSWLFAIGASSITDLVCSLPYKAFDNFWFLFLLSISVVPGEIEDNYATFSGEGANKKLYYDVQIAKSLRLPHLNYLCQLVAGGTLTCVCIVRHFSPSGVSVISCVFSHR